MPAPAVLIMMVLDPACGSGNFLYLALLAMKDLWKHARVAEIWLSRPGELHPEFLSWNSGAPDPAEQSEPSGNCAAAAI